MSLEEVREQFDLPRLYAFTKSSKQYPPQYVLIASYFGFGEPTKRPTEDDTADFIQQLMQAFPPPQ